MRLRSGSGDPGNPGQGAGGQTPIPGSRPGAARDDYWCDEVASAVWRLFHRKAPIDLGNVLATVPSEHHTDAVIDAAIRHCMDALIRARCVDGTEARVKLADELIARHPELASHIRLCMLLDCAAPSCAATSDSTAAGVGQLAGDEDRMPRDFGPAWRESECRYILVERLRGGRRSAAYRAIDRARSDAARGHQVAVKVLGDVRVASERVAEASRLARIDSPFVGRVIDAGVCGGRAYVVSEFLDGIPLGRISERAVFPLPPEQAVAIVRDVATGLAEAHIAGVRHLDIHPNNVVIGGAGHAVLIDFDLGRGPGDVARELDELAADRAEAPRLGAPGFIAPELVRSQPTDRVLARCDVYSVVGLLLWLVSGRVPNGGSPDEVNRLMCQDLPEYPLSLNGLEIDPDLLAILRRGLCLDAGRRYGSAAELLNDLSAWQAHEPLWWNSPSPTRRLRLAARRTKPAVVAAYVAAACIGLLLVGATVWARLDGLSRERDAAIARAEVNESARAAAEASASSARIATEQVRQIGRFSPLLRSLLQSPMTRQGAEWVVLFTAARDLAEPLGRDPALAEALATRRIDLLSKAARVVSPSMGQAPEPSIEEAILAATLGSWEMEAGTLDRAEEHLGAAALSMASLVAPNEPLRQRIEWRWQVAKVLRSKGTDAAAVAACRAKLEFLGTLPADVRTAVESIVGP